VVGFGVTGGQRKAGPKSTYGDELPAPVVALAPDDGIAVAYPVHGPAEVGSTKLESEYTSVVVVAMTKDGSPSWVTRLENRFTKTNPIRKGPTLAEPKVNAIAFLPPDRWVIAGTDSGQLALGVKAKPQKLHENGYVVWLKAGDGALAGAHRWSGEPYTQPLGLVHDDGRMLVVGSHGVDISANHFDGFLAEVMPSREKSRRLYGGRSISPTRARRLDDERWCFGGTTYVDGYVGFIGVVGAGGAVWQSEFEGQDLTFVVDEARRPVLAGSVGPAGFNVGDRTFSSKTPSLFVARLRNDSGAVESARVLEGTSDAHVADLVIWKSGRMAVVASFPEVPGGMDRASITLIDRDLKELGKTELEADWFQLGNAEPTADGALIVTGYTRGVLSVPGKPPENGPRRVFVMRLEIAT
jgi:hypothetical protein